MLNEKNIYLISISGLSFTWFDGLLMIVCLNPEKYLDGKI